MNAVHLHLLITHLPILGTLIALILLSAGIYFDQISNRKAAYTLFIVCGIAAFVSSASGEQAEILLQENSHFDVQLIEAHQKYAGTAFVWAVIIAALSIVAWWFEAQRHSFLGKLHVVLLIISLANFGLLSWVGYQGGKIAHQEIRA